MDHLQLTPTSAPTNTAENTRVQENNLLLSLIKGSNVNSESCKDFCSTNQAIYGIFHSIMFLIAIFLSMRCNNGFNLGSFLVACICPYIYIIFILLTEYDKGICGLIHSNK